MLIQLNKRYDDINKHEPSEAQFNKVTKNFRQVGQPKAIGKCLGCI